MRESSPRAVNTSMTAPTHVQMPLPSFCKTPAHGLMSLTHSQLNGSPVWLQALFCHGVLPPPQISNALFCCGILEGLSSQWSHLSKARLPGRACDAWRHDHIARPADQPRQRPQRIAPSGRHIHVVPQRHMQQGQQQPACINHMQACCLTMRPALPMTSDMH